MQTGEYTDTQSSRKSSFLDFSEISFGEVQVGVCNGGYNDIVISTTNLNDDGLRQSGRRKLGG